MLRRLVSAPRRFGISSSLLVRAYSVIVARPPYPTTAIVGCGSITQVHDRVPFDVHSRPSQIAYFSTAVCPLSIESEGGLAKEVLLKKLENALEHHQVAEAWETFAKFKRVHGFPDKGLVRRLITQLSYSDPNLVRKGYDLFLLIQKAKPDFLHYDFLARLALSLARTQMTVPASTVLRVMLQRRKFPPMDLWRTAFLHMVKTEIGTYLASDILVDVCDCFLHHMKENGGKNTKHLKLLKPDIMIFNLVLDACVRFQSTLRAEQIIELMPVIGIVANASTILVIARIFEMNGLRDELKKLRDHIDQVPAPLLRNYRQLYDSLLSLHFRFDDLDAAAELILNMYKRHGSLLSSGSCAKNKRKDPQTSASLTIGSSNLKTALRLQIEPGLLQKDSIISAEGHPEMVIFKDGKLIPSNKALAKLIVGYRRHGQVGELSKLLIAIKKESSVSEEAGLSLDVLGACTQLGWLETAHDILDDLELAGIPIDCNVYLRLLQAYYKRNMLGDVEVLLKQIRKAGLLMTLSNEEMISKCLLEEGCTASVDTISGTLGGKSGLVESLIQEMSDGMKPIPPVVYEVNSSIYFFCKGNMIEDARKTYHRMQERGLQPTVLTFAYLVNGYSLLKMYREVTILWGEIRRRMDSGHLGANRDLLEMLLWNFIRGGYFQRVMEVLEYMGKHGMYTDKWKYKREFLKFHGNLYRTLKAEQAKTEAQVKRLEQVQAFRKWLSTD